VSRAQIARVLAQSRGWKRFEQVPRQIEGDAKRILREARGRTKHGCAERFGFEHARVQHA